MADARQIERALAQKYLIEQAGWAFLREVTIDDLVAQEAFERLRNGGPWDPSEYQPVYRRIDALLMKTSAFAKPVPFERLAIEIKVSRSDFRRDTDEKRRAWQAVAHRFAYATPPGLLSPEELPAGCGLIEVAPEAAPFQRVKWRKRAPRRAGAPNAFNDRFVAYLAGRASRAEHALRAAEPLTGGGRDA